MQDFLFVSEFSLPATAAVWATIASLAASALLVLYTLELRIHRRNRERRKARIIVRWRGVIARAVAGDDSEPASYPSLPRRERKAFLHLWNTTRNMIEGDAGERLIALAHDLGLVEFVRELATKSRFSDRVTAIQALGHLRDAESFDHVLAAAKEANTLLSIAAAEALIEIDPVRAVPLLIPMLPKRRDWPRTHVFRLLQRAGSELIGEPLFRGIRSSSAGDAAYLLQYTEIAEYEVRDAIAAEILRARRNPELLAAALKSASGYRSVPGLDRLLEHPASYVRMQVAKLMGRIGGIENAGRLEGLLADPEWWVRYRAATALLRLPELTRSGLEQVLSRQHDPYAIDILEQAMAEQGMR